jgi:putative solute:sodium symporter small subunit
MSEGDHKKYWRTNIIIILTLLTGWFFVSFVLGIFFVEDLNEIRIGGFKLGFWIAQQGSIFFFIGLVLTYVLWIEKVDKEFHVEEKKDKGESK